MSRLRIVSWPMRSVGPNAASPTRSIESFSGAYDRFGPGRVEDRVVLAAAQAQRDRAVDRRADPLLDRLAQHERLRLEPAALVHEAPEPAALLVVGREGVFVQDAVHQALVRDEQQRHRGRLVDATALRLDDAVLDLVAHAQAVPAADAVRLVHELDGVGVLDAVDRDGPAQFEGDGDVLGGDLDRRIPEAHAHDRLDGLERDVEVLERLGLVGGAPDVRVGRVRLLGAVAIREAVLDEPGRHLGAAAELGDEVGVQPRLVDAQPRVGEQTVAVEPLDVVALVGRAVAPDVDAVVLHRTHEQGAGHRPAERRGVEVGLAARADVECAARQRAETLLHERGLAVDQPRDLRTVLERPPGDRVDVVLVGLAEVARVGAGDGALVAHPGDGDGCVEAPGESDADALADGEGLQDLRHPSSLLSACRSPLHATDAGSVVPTRHRRGVSDVQRAGGRGRRPCASLLASRGTGRSR